MKILITAALLIVATAGFAQKSNVYFYTHNGQRVGTRDSADYIRLVIAPDSGAKFFKVVDTYKDGSRRLAGQSSTAAYYTPEGRELTFYSNGRTKTVADYTNGHLTGTVTDYFANGRVHTVRRYPADATKADTGQAQNYDIVSCSDSTGKVILKNGNGYYEGYDNDFARYNVPAFKEAGPVKNGKRNGRWTGGNDDLDVSFTATYANGVLTGGTAIDSRGITRNFTKRLNQPGFQEGRAAFIDFLSVRMIYPSYARDNKINGIVELMALVKADGKLTDIKVIKSPHVILSQEAVRVVNLSKDYWQAGTLYGIPVDMLCDIPIGFNMAGK